MLKSLLVVLALVGLALASHGRFGTIKFVKSPTNPRLVTFTLNAVFRRTYFSGPPNVGSTISDAAFTFGDGSSVTPSMLVTEINTADDWVVVTWTGSHTYAGAGNYQVGWASCCRIFALNNNPSYSYAHTALIKLTASEISKAITPNNSPVSGMLPIVPVPINVVPFTYDIKASDPENDVLTYTMATAAQQGDPSSSQPHGLSVNSANGKVTLSQALAQGYWTTQQIVTDTFGNWISIDYILNVQPVQTYCNGQCVGSPNPNCVTDADCSTCNTTCVAALPRLITNDINSGMTPATNLPTPANQQTFNRNVGQTVTFNYVADDANLRNPTNPVTIYASNTPAGSSLSPQVECNALSSCICVGCNARPQIRTFTWTPTNADVGSNTVCVGVQSMANYLPYSQHCVTINVIARPITSGDMTTQSLTTESPLTTQSLTTTFLSVAARCATYNMPETQGYFCTADHTGYYQCLKGPWASQSGLRPCPAGTSCKCAEGVDCSSQGICTSPQ